MARLAYVAHGLRGSLYNTLAFGRRLIADGHEITLLSFRDVGADASANGIDFIHLAAGPDAWREVRASIANRGQVLSIPTAIRARRRVVASTEVRDRIRGLGIDLVLVDAEMHGAIVQLDALAVPIALVVPWHSIFYEPGLAPMHTELRPDADRRSIDEAWSTLWNRRASVWSRPFDLRQLPSRLGPFHLNSPDPVNIAAVGRRHRVDYEARTSRRDWMNPHVWTSYPTLSYTTAEFDFARQPPAAFHYLGPVIDNDRPEPLVSIEDQARCDSFLADRRAAGQKIAFCSMGSLQSGNVAWYRTVIEAFADAADWSVVIGLGSQVDATQMAAVTAGLSTKDVLILAYAPQLSCLAAADVAIHTAGTGTFYECLKFAVPSIAVHSGFVDQPGIAARIEHFGLGRALSESDFTPTNLRVAADELLGDQATTRRLAGSAQVVQGYVDDRRAERAVEAILSRHHPSRAHLSRATTRGD